MSSFYRLEGCGTSLQSSRKKEENYFLGRRPQVWVFAGVVLSVMRRSTFGGIMRQSWRQLACAAQRNDPRFSMNLKGYDIMRMSANKATRFVYLRTLPLVKQAELQGKVEEIASDIETMTRNICEKHAGTLSDDRSAVHLHTAALAIATHRVLSPQIKNEIRLSNIIRSGFGAAQLDNPSVPDKEKQLKDEEKRRPDFWIVKAALWFSFDRMAAVRKMTSNMVRDFGSQFETESHDDKNGPEQKHELIVKKCYYNTLCRQEGLPHLTRIFCALDKAIYSPITVRSHGVEFSLTQTLADNISDTNRSQFCNFTFVKKS